MHGMAGCKQINMEPESIQGLSSMATRLLLQEIVTAWQQQGGAAIAMESLAGVDVMQRVQAGQAFDVVILASQAVRQLEAAGWVQAGSKLDLLRSPTAVAVPAGSCMPDLSSEEAVRAAVLAAPCIGYSSGPSGSGLLALFARWGISGQMQPRMVQAKPGVPVGALVATGQVTMGFQQLSELIHVPGIAVAGSLPPSIAIDTVFSAGIATGTSRADAVRLWLAFLASPACAMAKRRQGMEPV